VHDPGDKGSDYFDLELWMEMVTLMEMGTLMEMQMVTLNGLISCEFFLVRCFWQQTWTWSVSLLWTYQRVDRHLHRG